MRAVLVTGSRDWTDEGSIRLALDKSNPDLVIHGEARGVDAIAGDYAKSVGTPMVPMPAQWERYRKEGRVLAAGPMRNREMLKVLLALRACGWEVCVLAFPLPGSKGTRDMIRIAREAGIKVIDRGKAARRKR